MNLRTVTVLYEDQRGPRKGFGLHELVKACIFDVVDGDRVLFEKALVDARPLKGSSSLLRACIKDLHDIARDGRQVVAVFDEDKIRNLLNLSTTATEEEVVAAIASRSSDPSSLHVVLLVRNQESIVGAVAACDPEVDPASKTLALGKSLNERDKVLKAASRAAKKPVRECVLQRVPSFRVLCDRIRAALIADAG